MQHSSALASLACVLTASPSLAGTAPDPVALGPLGGAVSSIAIHPQNPSLILHTLQDGGGLQLSTDGGQSLQPYGTGLTSGAQDLTKHPLEEDTLFVLDGDSVFRSEDFGATWQHLGLDTGDTLWSIAVDATGEGILVRSFDAIHHSADGGATWSDIDVGFVESSVAYDPGNPSIAYMGDIDGLWKSTDGGATFAKHGAHTQWTQAITVSPVDSDILFVNGQAGVFRSLDGGLSFDQVASDGNGEFFVWEPNGVRLWNVMLGLLAYSDDHGDTWLLANDGLPQDPPVLSLGIDFDSSGKPFLASRGGGLNDNAGGGLYGWDSQTSSWDHIGHLASHVRDVAIAAPGGARIIGMGGGVYAGAAGQDLAPTAWHSDLGTDTRALVVDPQDPDRWVTGGVGAFLDNAQIVVVSEGGSVFQKTFELAGAGRVEALAFDPFNANRMLAGVFPGGFGAHAIMRSTNSGQNWTGIPGTNDWGTFAVAFDPFAPGRVVQLSYNNQWSGSSNGGQTWLPLQPAWPGAGFAVFLAFDPFAQGVVYRGETGAGLWRSDDGMASWSPLGVGLHEESHLFLHPEIPGLLWVSDDSGQILVSGDRGDTFALQTTVPQGKSATGLAIDTASGALLFGTTGVSAWEQAEASPYVTLGGGTAGTGDFVPRHYFTGGLPSVGNPSLVIGGDRIVGGAAVTLLVGLSEISFPLIGGELHAGPPLVLIASATASGTPGLGGAGSFAIPIAVPNDPSLAGVELISQIAAIDTGAADPSGIVLGNGLRTTLQ